MDSLPQEILTKIIPLLKIDQSRKPQPLFDTSLEDQQKQEQRQHQLAPCATISRTWQYAIEQYTFSRLSISSDELDLFHFAVVKSPHRHRRAALKRIDFSVRLPDYDDNACARFERWRDLQANDEAFSKAITGLFTSLTALDTNDGSRPIELHLADSYSSMDTIRRNKANLAKDREAAAIGQRNNLFELRYRDSYLELLQPKNLPLLYNVTSLTIAGDKARKLAPAVAISIIAKLPNLVDTTLSFSDMERKRPQYRIQLRSDFIRQFKCITISRHLRKFVLSLRHTAPANQNFVNADIRGGVYPGHTDDLSVVLRRFSQATLSPELFRGIGGEVMPVFQQQWRNLKTFTVELSAVRPDGGWYTELDPVRNPDSDTDEDEDPDLDVDDDTRSQSPTPSYDSNDSFFASNPLPPDNYGYEDEKRHARLNGDAPSSTFRMKPTPELEDFFTAAAYAASCMTSLRRMEVALAIPRCGRTNGRRQKIGFTYMAAGVKGGLKDVESERVGGRLIWDAPQGWRMGERLQDQWQSVLGGDSIVRYTEW
ncbi:hypothetical protein E4T38_07974 [Aureobasidium subglaciale]|nr:hypothetical protein E4T38_07974 [Aureobasidium subglaciale]KAI5216450.1 hypothetical protein E4T40_07984 [Aureobasidium subglaciale]KAI5219634.1 hypothetical protein E4T41_07846 [Aureobasidium subglaciale]KAI5257639.1 hypothetical protein E4T46_07875 [Aureobasidium subglaciale]